MQRNFVSIFLVFVGLLFAGCSQEEKLTASEERPNPLLLISFDGFMNEYLERNETPNFDTFIQSGVRAEYLIPVFPTKTFPNNYTIVTGLYPENHGVISNRFSDSKLNARFSFGPVDSPNDERWWGGEPIWITAEKQGLTSATFFWPGGEATINGIQSTKWVQFDGSVPDRVRIDSVMAWMDPNGSVQADFGSLYFSFVDGAGHDFGPNSPEADQAVLRADSLVGYLFEKMNEHNLADKLNIIIVSDHGMAELSPERVIFLDEIIDLDEVEMIDWTPVALIQPEKNNTDEVYSVLKENENHYKVFLKDELPGHYHFSDHYRIPEIIMIADVGYTISTRNFLENNEVLGGTHGFDYQAPEMRTIFIAGGPDFQKGKAVEPFQSVHIYELMCEILGLKPAENDGSVDLLKHVLR